MRLKTVKNESLQTLEVYIKVHNGVKAVLLYPGEVKTIPVDCISENIKKLCNRRMLSLENYN